jgi:hypothetical protein
VTESEADENGTEESTVVAAEVEQLRRALLRLAEQDQQVAIALARVISAVVREAERTPRFRKILLAAFDKPGQSDSRPQLAGEQRRSHRRAPGVLDPFALFAEGGEGLLRERLHALDLEQMRDIVAEHGMDRDRLAMKWKDRDRVVGRIVETVEARATKGQAFRSAIRP